MCFKSKLLVQLGRILAWILRKTGHQAGTLPGRIMLKFDADILAKLSLNKQIIAITGTNGKTTTTSLISNILKAQGYNVVSNSSGANLLSGIITTLATATKDAEVFVIEIDEATWGAFAQQLLPRFLVVTNIFRDQLDRYGEVSKVYNLLANGIKVANPNLLLDADDPLVANLQEFSSRTSKFFSVNVQHFVVNDKQIEHCYNDDGFQCDLATATCPKCQSKLVYDWKTIGHMGNFTCLNCRYHRPTADYSFTLQGDKLRLFYGSLDNLCYKGKTNSLNRYYETSVDFNLPGLFNAYNACAAVTVATEFLLNKGRADFIAIVKSLATTKSSFGRQEEIKLANGHTFNLLLVKNPVGFAQTLALLQENKPAKIVFLLNSRLADSTDISWIWDVPFENYTLQKSNLYVAGERGSDLALRLTYAGYKLAPTSAGITSFNLCKQAIDQVEVGEKVAIVANYTAMLNIREQLAKHYGFAWQWDKELK